MGWHSFSTTFQNVLSKDNKFHVLFRTEYVDVEYLIVEIYLHVIYSHQYITRS